jgi:hypothetical protein
MQAHVVPLSMLQVLVVVILYRLTTKSSPIDDDKLK